MYRNFLTVFFSFHRKLLFSESFLVTESVRSAMYLLFFLRMLTVCHELYLVLAVPRLFLLRSKSKTSPYFIRENEYTVHVIYHVLF